MSTGLRAGNARGVGMLLRETLWHGAGRNVVAGERGVGHHHLLGEHWVSVVLQHDRTAGVGTDVKTYETTRASSTAW